MLRNKFKLCKLWKANKKRSSSSKIPFIQNNATSPLFSNIRKLNALCDFKSNRKTLLFSLLTKFRPLTKSLKYREIKSFDQISKGALKYMANFCKKSAAIPVNRRSQLALQFLNIAIQKLILNVFSKDFVRLIWKSGFPKLNLLQFGFRKVYHLVRISKHILLD